MIKKITVEQLKPGMYIHDLNCSWLEHPFFGSSLKVQNHSMVSKIIKHGIRELYIDTDKGSDVDGASKEEKKVEKKEKDVDENVADILPVEVKDEIVFDEIQPVSVKDEIFKARKVKKEALKTVQKVMTDIVGGGEIEKEVVVNTVDDIIVSVLRNKDALAGLGMLRSADEYLYQHSINVCALMVAFGKYLGFDSQLLRDVGVGALLHDVGISRVPKAILDKKTTLTEDEFEEIKKHVQYGREILEETKGISEISIITAYHHHEKLDGSGYPNGMMGERISYTGQALAIVDVYDALTTKRCHRRRIPPTQALQILYEWCDTKLNRELVEKFIRCIGIYPVGSLVRLKSGLVGVVTDHSDTELMKPVVRVIYDSNKDSYIAIPFDVDLSDKEQNSADDCIVGYESQDKMDVQPEVYL